MKKRKIKEMLLRLQKRICELECRSINMFDDFECLEAQVESLRTKLNRMEIDFEFQINACNRKFSKLTADREMLDRIEDAKKSIRNKMTDEAFGLDDQSQSYELEPPPKGYFQKELSK